MNKISWCFIVAALAVSPLQAEEINFKKGERPAHDVKRDKQSKGGQVIELAGIKPGMTVLDLFGGGGYYTELLAEQVGQEGSVYLHNNKAYMPYIEKELSARLAGKRLANVIDYQREADALELNDKQFDAVFWILGYHDLYHKVDGWDIDKEQLFKQLFPTIKTGGTFVIIDHSAPSGTATSYAQELHRIDKQYVIDELSQYGFKLTKESDLLSNRQDTRELSPFKPEMRRKTDRFVLIFTKV